MKGPYEKPSPRMPCEVSEANRPFLWIDYATGRIVAGDGDPDLETVPRRKDAEEALFIGRQGRLKKRRIQNLFLRYSTEAGLPPDRRHVHVLRHSVAVHLLDAGEHIDFARDHLGHRSIESTLVYTQISDSRRNRTMRRLARSREFPIPS